MRDPLRSGTENIGAQRTALYTVGHHHDAIGTSVWFQRVDVDEHATSSPLPGNWRFGAGDTFRITVERVGKGTKRWPTNPYKRATPAKLRKVKA